MEETVLAVEMTTRVFFNIFWVENAKHNAVEDPGHPGREVSYHECLGRVDFSELITRRANGYEVWGTREERGTNTEASLRETTVDAEFVANGDPDAEK